MAPPSELQGGQRRPEPSPLVFAPALESAVHSRVPLQYTGIIPLKKYRIYRSNVTKCSEYR